MGHCRYQCAALNQWGELHLKDGDLDAASRAFERSYDIARDAGLAQASGEASFGLARVAALRGDTAEARRMAGMRIAAYSSVAHPKAGEVGRWLETDWAEREQVLPSGKPGGCHLVP